MKVSELIEALQSMPPDAKVKQLWDGELRTEINLVWLSKSGVVVTADYAEPCYSDESMPANNMFTEHWTPGKKTITEYDD